MSTLPATYHGGHIGASGGDHSRSNNDLGEHGEKMTTILQRRCLAYFIGPPDEAVFKKMVGSGLHTNSPAVMLSYILAKTRTWVHCTSTVHSYGISQKFSLFLRGLAASF